MAIIITAILFVFILIIIFEYRLRTPDQIVLFEKNSIIQPRKTRFYPRHFSMAINGGVHSQITEFEAEAKGHLLINIRIVLTVAADNEHLDNLIRTGGWKENCVNAAVDEGKILLESMAKEFCAQYDIEELSSEKLTGYLKKKLEDECSVFGLTVVSLNTQSIEPQEKDIITALQQREEARLEEQTEKTRQKVRTNIAQTKALADQQILEADHALELKRLELKKIREKNTAELARERISEELRLKNMQLDFEKREMELLQDNPELLMLSPQLARLAEASQQLPNAKTVVSLGQGDLQQGSQIVESIQNVLQTVFSKKPNDEKKNK